ncbi:hypothetical protein CLV59_104222 [Chitinophaga dinghuensis]|uniref:Uncharacterized protein n=1 Tax=Chitinophaga dinghuensis TaxID=1539050 RepID=A0A327VYC0_9BACT|nr:hypothetical protein CLV59_104222 [Chitinophaga dinghuensis]
MYGFWGCLCLFGSGCELNTFGVELSFIVKFRPGGRNFTGREKCSGFITVHKVCISIGVDCAQHPADRPE